MRSGWIEVSGANACLHGATEDNDASRWREPRSVESPIGRTVARMHACPSAVAVSAERHEAAIPLGRLTGRMHDNGTSQSGATSESKSTTRNRFEIGSGATIGRPMRPLSCSRLPSVTVAHCARPASRNLALETGTLGTTFSTGTTRQKPSVMNRAGTLSKGDESGVRVCVDELILDRSDWICI